MAPLIDAITISPSTPWKNGLVTIRAKCHGFAPLQYQWNLGDGEFKTSISEEITHKYLQGGEIKIGVTCITGDGGRAHASIITTVDDIDIGTVFDRACSGVILGHGFCIQNPYPVSTELNTIAAVDRTTLWAAGNGGSILKSTDGGNKWNIQKSGVLHNLNSISNFGSSLAWIAGDFGTILTTVDGGKNWGIVKSPTTNSLNQIKASSEKVVWIAGNGEILRSTDGGESWSRQYTGTQNWRAVSSNDPSVAWVAGSNEVRRTEDGGSSWINITPPEVRVYSWNSICSTDNDNAWLLSDIGHVFHTSNRGNTWELQEYLSLEGSASSIFCVNKSIIWVVANSVDLSYFETSPIGVTLLTTDAGKTWSKIKSNFGLRAIAALNENQAWLVGNKLIIETNDSGNSWITHSSGNTSYLSSVVAKSDFHAWVTSRSGEILRTTDGGVNWLSKKISYNPLLAIATPDQRTIFSVGLQGAIWKTSDGGDSWYPSNSGTTRPLVTVAAPNSSVAWVAGENGTLLRTDDGGGKWAPQTIPYQDNITAVRAVDDRTAWAVTTAPVSSDRASRRGSVFKTENAGLNWFEQFNSSTHNFIDAASVNSSTAWALAVLDERDSSGYPRSDASPEFAVYKTTNGGMSWLRVWGMGPSTSAGGGLDATSISALDERRAMVTTRQGVIFQTVDGGGTWVAITTPGGSSPSASSIASTTAAWAVGSGGLILKSVTWASDK